MKTLSALESAWAFREPFFKDCASSETNAYRLFCGEGEGIAGLVADRMGEALFLHRFEGTCPLSEAELRSTAEWYLGKTGVAAVYLKEFLAHRSKGAQSARNKSPEPLVGRALPEEIAVRERGHRLFVRPYDGFSTGIFLDQRENRRALAEGVAGASVLNLFAYTGGFSVFGAKAGARTTNVDLSSRYLEWGKRNFAANGLEPKDHEFFAADTFQFLKGAKKRGRRFDLVVVDPPSFSRDRQGGIFSVAKDAARLLQAAAEVVQPGGRLFFSTNYEQWNQESFLRESELLLLGKPLPLPSVPKDFERQSRSLLCGLVRV